MGKMKRLQRNLSRAAQVPISASEALDRVLGTESAEPITDELIVELTAKGMNETDLRDLQSLRARFDRKHGSFHLPTETI